MAVIRNRLSAFHISYFLHFIYNSQRATNRNMTSMQNAYELERCAGFVLGVQYDDINGKELMI